MSNQRDPSRGTPASPRRPSRRKHDPLLVNGVSALLAGAGLWIISLAMRDEATLKAASRALLAPAWMALAVGVALLLLHVVIRRRTRFEAALLLRQHSRFHEPMPPVLNLPERQSRASTRSRKRPQHASAD